jgi:CDP-paratose 2-epimerase
MALALVTGSAGLIGSESVKFLIDKGLDVVGIDNNMREYFFGKDASTVWNRDFLIQKYKNYYHFNIDIRNNEELEKIFKKFKFDLIIHTAAQPSHDWAANEPITDFTINANGTLLLLENFRKHCPDAVFIFTSTNKVYGDTPNKLPLEEHEKRFEIPKNHKYYNGIDESMSIDQSLHSLFGASKVAADILVQEYGKYFHLKTVCFRGGCLTGPAHSGTMLHGFLSYLMRCCIREKKYYIYGYKGKQVRDNIHSYDLVNMLWHFYQNPREGEVYNAGGSRFSNCSILEAIEICEELTGKKLNYEYSQQNRTGDHIWYISDISKFQSHYPEWKYTYSLTKIIEEIYDYQSYLYKKGVVEII